MVFSHSQFLHPLLPQNQDFQATQKVGEEISQARQAYFGLLKKEIETLMAGNSTTTPQLRKQLDAIPTIKEANQQRSQLQDKMWAYTQASIESDRNYLIRAYEQHIKGPSQVELNSDLVIPRHQTKVDIHRMPGGYLKDEGEGDFWNGVLYDHGVFLYGRGWLGPLNDEFGHTIIEQVLKSHYPQFNPQKILDMGCSVGHSTLPYNQAYPEAEVWGIDLGASLLRYATARANGMGHKVYFAQQNAEKTDFPDNSFDLVVSHIIMHEIPNVAKQRIFKESYRLLKTGGIMVHLDSLLFMCPSNPLMRYFRDTEVSYNSEPFVGCAELDDLHKSALEAGFAPKNCHPYKVPGYYAEQQGSNQPKWLALCGVKS
jgi:SAM-dependent methyltransferase